MDVNHIIAVEYVDNAYVIFMKYQSSVVLSLECLICNATIFSSYSNIIRNCNFYQLECPITSFEVAMVTYLPMNL